MTMSKKNVSIVVVVVVLLAIAIGFLQYKQTHRNNYSVVYLSTGEVYVGNLTTFPDLELRNGYILQVTKDTTDPTKTNFQLNPINQALWAPSVLHIIEKNVVFYGPLLPESTIAKKLAEQK